MKNRRITSTLLLLAMLAASSSCDESTPAADDTTADDIIVGDTTPEVTTEAKPTLPEADYNGYEFTFLNGNTSYTYASVVSEEQNGETMNDAIYHRNTKVEERYNITIREIITKEPQADYTQAVTAGDDSFDLALLRMEWAFPVVLDNSVVSWDNIPHLNLDEAWWVQGSIDSMSLMNKVYFAVSQFDTSHFESVRAFVYNKDMAEDFKLDSPYELVNSGKWTLDAFYKMGTAVAADLNSDGAWTEADRYGVTSYNNVLCNTLMCGVGSILSIGKDKDDAPYFDLDKEPHMSRLLRVAELFAEQNGFADRMNKQEMFKNGTALFRCCLFSEVAALRDMEDDFGILPAPKLDESQKEYINLGGSPFFMVVPVTADNLDRTGAVMEALAYDSMDLIDTAYYDIVLKGKASRDEESIEMLDLICSTLYYYHPLANSYLNAPLANDYIWNASTDFASYFASVKEQINKDIETAMDTFSANNK